MKSINESIKEFETNEKVNEAKFEVRKTPAGTLATFKFKDDEDLESTLKEIRKKHKIEKDAGGERVTLVKNNATVSLEESVDEKKNKNPLEGLESGASEVTADLMGFHGVTDTSDVGGNKKAKKEMLDSIEYAEGVLEMVKRKVNGL